MYTKFTCLALSLILALTLCACGKTGTDVTEPSNIPGGDQASEPQNNVGQQIVFEETVLVDNENCTFKIVAIEEDNVWGYTLKAFLENKTDLELMFSVTNVSVNGFMCDPLWAASVQPGMKANEEISFSKTSLKQNNIDEVTQIQFQLNVYDNNDWTAEHLVSEIFTVYPLGEDAVKEFQRQDIPGEIVLFDDENCTMIVTGFEPDHSFGYAVNIYLENKTGKNLMFSATSASINGFMCDPYWATVVAAGMRSNTQIIWMNSDLEANNITSVETISLPLRVYDADEILSDDLVDDTFTVTP